MPIEKSEKFTFYKLPGTIRHFSKGFYFLGVPNAEFWHIQSQNFSNAKECAVPLKIGCFTFE